MKNPHVKRQVLILFVAVLASMLLGIAQLNAASTVPSTEITGSAQSPTNICDNATGALSFVVPTWENSIVGSSTSGEMSVAGVGNVRTFDENILVTRNQAWIYGFDGIDPYNVPANTLVTLAITSYFGLNQTGGVSHVSEIVFECDDGANLVKTNTAFPAPAAPIPAMSVWSMLILVLAILLLMSNYWRSSQRSDSK